MVRPFEKYPVNHHLAQVLERVVAVGAVRGSGDRRGGERSTATSRSARRRRPTFDRFGDSWSSRLTLLPLAGVELSGSIARVDSPEMRSGAWTRSAQGERRRAVQSRRRRTRGATRWSNGRTRTSSIAASGSRRCRSVLVEGAYCRAGVIVARARSSAPIVRRKSDWPIHFARRARRSISRNLGVSRWTTVTLIVSRACGARPASFRRDRSSRSRASVRRRETRRVSSIRSFRYGADRMWMISAGVRLRRRRCCTIAWGATAPRFRRDVDVGNSLGAGRSLISMPGMPDMPSGAARHASGSTPPTRCSSECSPRPESSSSRRTRRLGLIACGGLQPTITSASFPASCPGIMPRAQRRPRTLAPQTSPPTMPVLGIGLDTMRYSGGDRRPRQPRVHDDAGASVGAQGNKVNIWDVSGDVSAARRLADRDRRDHDGRRRRSATTARLLVVATELRRWLDRGLRPRPIRATRSCSSRFTNDQTDAGVHTAEIGRVNGKLYAFLSIDPSGAERSGAPRDRRPAARRRRRGRCTSRSAGSSVRARHVSARRTAVRRPLERRRGHLGHRRRADAARTPGDPAVARQREDARRRGAQHLVVPRRRADRSGSRSSAKKGRDRSARARAGDIHVVDLSDLTAPKEVAFYHVDGAGTHNFSVDEANGVLYAAYYNGGVRALDVRGDLGTCAANQQTFRRRSEPFAV